jgi:hypothetical protein
MSQCAICADIMTSGQIVLLRCGHGCCKNCLFGYLENRLDEDTVCPYPECKIMISYDTKKEICSWIKCSICFDLMTPEQQISLTCGHSFCKDCLVGYLENRLNENHIDTACPDISCQTLISYDIIRSILTEKQSEHIKRFDYLVYCKPFRNQSNCIFCTYCEMPFIMKKDKLVIRCPHCSVKFCKECSLKKKRNIFHKFACEEIKRQEKVKKKKQQEKKQHQKENNMTKKFFDNTITTKKCPQCGIFIEYTGGCRNMVCTKCEARYNWETNTLVNRNRRSK